MVIRLLLLLLFEEPIWFEFVTAASSSEVLMPKGSMELINSFGFDSYAGLVCSLFSCEEKGFYFECFPSVCLLDCSALNITPHIAIDSVCLRCQQPTLISNILTILIVFATLTLFHKLRLCDATATSHSLPPKSTLALYSHLKIYIFV